MKQTKTRRNKTRAKLKRARNGLHYSDRLEELINKTPLRSHQHRIKHAEKVKYRIAIVKILEDEYKEKGMKGYVCSRFGLRHPIYTYYKNYTNYPDIEIIKQNII